MNRTLPLDTVTIEGLHFNELSWTFNYGKKYTSFPSPGENIPEMKANHW